MERVKNPQTVSVFSLPVVFDGIITTKKENQTDTSPGNMETSVWV